MATTTRDIFALPGELSRAILASVEGEEDEVVANGRNAVLNRMALVGHLWHNLLAPPDGACMLPALARRVTLGEPDMLQCGDANCAAVVAVCARTTKCHGHRAGESGCWVLCRHHAGTRKLQAVHGHRAGKSGCLMPCHQNSEPHLILGAGAVWVGGSDNEWRAYTLVF